MYSQVATNKRKTVIIMVLFVAFIGGLSYLFGALNGSPSLTPLVLLGALIYALISYFIGSKMILAISKAQPIDKKQNPRLWRVVENLSITEGLPMPKVYIMDDPALNAFATGRDPNHAIVCATSGLLDALDDQELEGVMAHELGHIKNYDIRVSMIAFALVAVVGILSDIMIRMSWSRDDDNNSSSNQLFIILAIVAAIIAPIVATIIQLAISRRREFLADATGALTTRYPEGLARALAKIKQGGSVIKKQSSSTAHLFFASPLKAKSFANLFSTHPPIEDRIAALTKMQTNL